MATAAASPARRPKHAVLRAVELFHEGEFEDANGRPMACSAADIDDMVRNFALFRPALEPPVGIGHVGQAQTVLAADDWPADGVVAGCWATEREVDGKPTRFLVGNVRVPPELGAWIDAGRLTRVSAEIDPQPPDDLTPLGGKGKTLKRVALLGFKLPMLKRLRPLPGPEYVYAEGTARRGFWTFAESRAAPMDRKQMEEMAQGYGLSPEFIKMLDDKQLAALIQEWQRLESGEADNTGAGAGAGADDTGQTQLSEGQAGAGGGGGAPKKVTVTQQFSEAVSAAIAPVLNQVATLTRQLNAQQQQTAALERQTAHRLGEERRATVDAALDRLKREGKVLAAELDPGPDNRPTLRDRLLRADSVRVHKFSEGGKSVEKTELQLQLDELEARPVLARFSERVPQGKASADPAGDAFRERLKKQYDAELAKPAGRRR